MWILRGVLEFVVGLEGGWEGEFGCCGCEGCEFGFCLGWGFWFGVKFVVVEGKGKFEDVEYGDFGVGGVVGSVVNVFFLLFFF